MILTVIWGLLGYSVFWVEYLVIMTSQIPSYDLSIALAVHFKLHDCDSAEIV